MPNFSHTIMARNKRSIPDSIVQSGCKEGEGFSLLRRGGRGTIYGGKSRKCRNLFIVYGIDHLFYYRWRTFLLKFLPVFQLKHVGRVKPV